MIASRSVSLKPTSSITDSCSSLDIQAPMRQLSCTSVFGRQVLMSKPGKTGIARVMDAFGYSMKGLATVWRHEAAFRQEVFLALVLLPAAFWLAPTHVELILLIASVFLVLMAELVNSAIEAVVDRIGPEKHELSGRAKDIGSALVLVSLLLLALVWCLVAWHRFI
jgi:diacylglycerol kinase (ATP)